MTAMVDYCQRRIWRERKMTLPNFDKSLKQYAELAVDIGVAVKPGDTVYLQIAVD